MMDLDIWRPMNMLAADALATAIVVDARILVRTDAPPLGATADALGVEYEVI